MTAVTLFSILIMQINNGYASTATVPSLTFNYTVEHSWETLFWLNFKIHSGKNMSMNVFEPHVLICHTHKHLKLLQQLPNSRRRAIFNLNFWPLASIWCYVQPQSNNSVITKSCSHQDGIIFVRFSQRDSWELKEGFNGSERSKTIKKSTVYLFVNETFEQADSCKHFMRTHCYLTVSAAL